MWFLSPSTGMALDKVTLRDALTAFAPIPLFGHEHSTGIIPGSEQVQLFAGAIQASRPDPEDWPPTGAQTLTFAQDMNLFRLGGDAMFPDYGVASLCQRSNPIHSSDCRQHA
jgi:hypothetical protein